jgi:hypothetical protein
MHEQNYQIYHQIFIQIYQISSTISSDYYQILSDIFSNSNEIFCKKIKNKKYIYIKFQNLRKPVRNFNSRNQNRTARTGLKSASVSRAFFLPFFGVDTAQ